MKVIETNYKDVLFKFNHETIENMVFQKEENSANETSDVGIVFGGISMIPNRLKEAEKLYKEGCIKKILVTGGIGRLNIDRITPEAVKMENYLRNHSIPKNDILVEPKAKNSYENIKYSLELLKERYNLLQTKLILITSDFHLKRCMGMMLKEEVPNFFGDGVKDGKTDLENWQDSLLGKRVIYQEAVLLNYYVKHERMVDFEFELIKAKNKRIHF